jgi:hypothetical protein
MARRSFTDDQGRKWTAIDASQPSDIILRMIALQLDDEHDVLLRRENGAVWYCVVNRTPGASRGG